VRFLGRSIPLHELPSLVPSGGEHDVSRLLAGPLRSGRSWGDAFAQYQRAELVGQTHLLYAEWQREYGGAQQLSANIVVPKLLFGREEGDVGRRAVPRRVLGVIVGNPADAARVARVHVKKQGNFTTAFYGSLISTTDVEHWRLQREHLVPAFLPQLSLSRVFPISAARARQCSERLVRETNNLRETIDMNEFLLHETEAQLQLALFGEDEAFMEATNQKFRAAMAGKHDVRFVRAFCRELVARFPRASNSEPMHPEEAEASASARQSSASPACPFKGPLANRVATFNPNDRSTQEGNACIFAFAGHDTTGHTLTWLLGELARHPAFQRQLQHEVDTFWAALAGREPAYEDLQKLPFMSRCITETLRLWPVVASGTFREIQFDDYITGPDGSDVLLPKGTLVQIPNWSRHRNPELWGRDVDTFNPNREFAGDELWNGQPLAYYNPASPRFSPFTFPPRGCIGMNFAHLESRLILLNLLRGFSFELTPDYLALEDGDPQLMVNYGTGAPRDLRQPRLVKYAEGGFTPSLRAPTGMHFLVRRRQPDARL
jgi:cytochrome P450